MAENSFVIDPQLLTQAKAYAKAAAEENMEYYTRLGKLIDELYAAIGGIDDAIVLGIRNNRITEQQGNWSARQSSLKKNSQRAEKLCEMLQMGLDQGEITERGIKDELQAVINLLLGLLGFSGAASAAAPESHKLEATKAVAVSGAALAGTFGLAQLDPFTWTGELLERFVSCLKGVAGGGYNQPDPTSPGYLTAQTSDWTARILTSEDAALPSVGTDRLQYESQGGQINCVWLARQKMCKIVGDDELFTDKKLGTSAASWKKYEESGINGFSVDYRTVSSGTTMSDIAETLSGDQPCSVMFYLNGHTFTVDRIQDGMVYWTDNFTPVGQKPYYQTGVSQTEFDGSTYPGSYTGLATTATLENFAKWYDSYAGAAKSYVVLKEQSK